MRRVRDLRNKQTNRKKKNKNVCNEKERKKKKNENKQVKNNWSQGKCSLTHTHNVKQMCECV